MKYLVLVLLVLLSTSGLQAQGCVAIRSMGNSCSRVQHGHEKSWLFNINNRYFRSYKHFVGSRQERSRVENGTEVINYSLSTDLSLTRVFNQQWSATLVLPVNANTRSSLYEHGGNNGGNTARHSTRSFGLGDARLAVYSWLLDPVSSPRFNVQAGLGIKFPTGNYRTEDYFYANDSTIFLGPVDQSIQLGDGGTGITLELNSFYQLSANWSTYLGSFYLLNPAEQNGVSTARGRTPSATAIKYFFRTMSIPDQWMVRAGLNHQTGKFNFLGGIRAEGIPSSDVLGGDKGFRRPGYVVSAEPVASYQQGDLHFYASLPVAIYRNRTKSYSDKLRTIDSGTEVHGDAAFADYSITVGMALRFK